MLECDFRAFYVSGTGGAIYSVNAGEFTSKEAFLKNVRRRSELVELGKWKGLQPAC